MHQSATIFVLVLLCLPAPTPAPVPRCSPFIFINKLAEWTNIWSDSNPYFPVPPCEYGGPLRAITEGDLRSVFVTSQPLNIPLHNLYEFVWLLKTGFPRMVRILAGKEPFEYDTEILREGFQHYTPYVRTGQLGHGTKRRPEIIDNKRTYKAVLGDKVGQLVREGPDRFPTAFTPQGQLPGRRSDIVKNRVFNTPNNQPHQINNQGSLANHRGDNQGSLTNHKGHNQFSLANHRGDLHFSSTNQRQPQEWQPSSSPLYRAVARR